MVDFNSNTLLMILSENVVSSPMDYRQRLSDWIEQPDLTICCLQ